MPASKPRLLITRALPSRIIDRARQSFEVTVWPHDRPIDTELENWAVGHNAVLVMATDPLDAERLTRLRPHVQSVATYSVGHDHIDLAAATQMCLPVFNTPDVLSEAVAEVAMFLILAAARDTSTAERALRSGEWGGLNASALRV